MLFTAGCAESIYSYSAYFAVGDLGTVEGRITVDTRFQIDGLGRTVLVINWYYEQCPHNNRYEIYRKQLKTWIGALNKTWQKHLSQN